ncbi:MAG TPA: hypothetical protein ENH84_01770, partial [Phycisphaerae bacterium]|nr:hypothetical protein [Phycisphaerae bacterium]
MVKESNKPGRPKDEERAEKVVATWRQYKEVPNRVKWWARAIISEGFYYNEQWTAKEVETMLAQGMWPAIKNRLAPPARKRISEYSSKAPQGKVVATSGANMEYGFIINGVLKHIEYISDRAVQVQRTAKDLMIKGGIGWLMPVVDPFSSDGLGDILIRNIPNGNVYASPTITEVPSLRDAPNIIIAKEEPLDYAQKLHPRLKSKLDEVKNYDAERV